MRQQLLNILFRYAIITTTAQMKTILTISNSENNKILGNLGKYCYYHAPSLNALLSNKQPDSAISTA